MSSCHTQARSPRWPWLIQMGQDRAGFHTYDWLERAVGASIHERTTRLIVRTRNDVRPRLLRLLDLITGEPAHLIMERGVLLGIRARAERFAAPAGASMERRSAVERGVDPALQGIEHVAPEEM